MVAIFEHVYRLSQHTLKDSRAAHALEMVFPLTTWLAGVGFARSPALPADRRLDEDDFLPAFVAEISFTRLPACRDDAVRRVDEIHYAGVEILD